MPTSYTVRTPTSTTYSSLRVGGAYLMTKSGLYILTKAGERIIVKIPGGELRNTSFGVRTPTTTSFTVRTVI